MPHVYATGLSSMELYNPGTSCIQIQANVSSIVPFTTLNK